MVSAPNDIEDLEQLRNFTSEVELDSRLTAANIKVLVSGFTSLSTNSTLDQTVKDIFADMANKLKDK